MNPIQLISTGGSGARLQTNQEALELISSEKRHVTVVTVIGPYRSGKSYLMNRLMGRSDGFPLGATVESKTKGFWLWMGDFPGDKNRCLILLDVEGLADVKKGNATHDLKLFTMALLLSSMFIYNTKGNIDASALDGLHLATKIVEELMTSEARKEEKNFARHFPHFIWAVRDHHLEMILNGKEVTPNDYLEHCLEAKIFDENSSSDQNGTEGYNKLRESIRCFFPKRECITFPPPVTNFLKMNHLEEVCEDELYPPFKIAADGFVQFVVQNAASKQIRGSYLSGFAFAKLIEHFLLSVEMKKLSINATFDMIAKEENRKAIEIGMLKFKEIILNMDLPLDVPAFSNIAKNAVECASKAFLENCIDIASNQSFQEQLNQQMKEIIKQKEEENIKISHKKCTDKLNQLLTKIQNDMKEKYLVDGGFEALKQDVDKLKLSYQQQVDSEEYGPCQYEALQEFEREKLLPIIVIVMNADEKMTKMKQDEARIKMEQERIAFETRRAAEQSAQQAEAAKAAKDAAETNYRNLLDTMKSQHKREMKQIRRQAKNDKAEKKRLEKEMKEREDRHNEEVTRQREREEELQRETDRKLDEERENMKRRNEEEQRRIREESDEGFFNNLAKVGKGLLGCVKTVASIFKFW